MIDFSSIKTTPCGKACHYFGMRIGLEGTNLHCFGVWTEYGVFEWNYSDAGERLFLYQGKWGVDHNAKPIAPLLKRKVWAYFLSENIWLSEKGPEHHDNFDHCAEVEVP